MIDFQLPNKKVCVTLHFEGHMVFEYNLSVFNVNCVLINGTTS